MSLTSKVEFTRSLALKVAVISLAVFGLIFANVNITKAQTIAEGFENVAGLPAAGWVSVNRSQPLGASVWSQCTGTAIPPAQAGAATSCALVNFNSSTGTGTISNWLIAPTVTLNNGDVVSFYTRTTSNTFPDRLQLRLSTSGTSSDTGTTATSVGVFTTLLVDVNPTYSGTYPIVWTQFTATISGLSGPTSGRVAFRYFVEDGGPDGANSNIIGIDTFAINPAPIVAPPQNYLDFDGNGRTDFVVTRNIGTGGSGATNQRRWFINLNGVGTVSGADWGIQTDILTPGNFDGDNRTDIAVWRPAPAGQAAFYILQSQTNTLRTEIFGQTGDDPTVIGDYDGDGRDDVAVYRAGATAGAQSTWFYRGSLNNPNRGISYFGWGANGDFPAPGDYDGDGRNDFVIQRNNGNGQATFWLNRTTAGITTQVFGLPSDRIVPGDYDGDGRTDVAVVRNSGGALVWYYLPSAGGAVVQRTFGASTDVPVQGEYDGDGRTDIGIWRASATAGATNFWYQGSTSGAVIVPFGATNDTPVASYNVH